MFDLDAGPVKITLPNAGKRFMSMQVINEDHYIFEVDYGAGNYNFTKAEVGTRYVLMVLRTLADPANPQDLKQAHALQDAVTVKQRTPGRFEVPNWDPVSQKKMRDALLMMNASLPDLRRAFGSRVQVDQVRHLIGTAAAWGGNPDRDAVYLNVTPSKNDGATIYKLSVPAKGPGQCLLVGHRLRRRRLFEEEPIRCVLPQQHHGEKERGWLSRHPVWRLRRQDSELPADNERLELHGAALSPT